MQLSDLTIIVPTKNESNNIVNFLDSIDKAVKLIVVDASSDDTRTLIAQHRPQNTTVIFEKSNIPAARQKGAEIAQTTWILFTDADMVFDKGYFKAWEKLALGDGIGGVVGGKYSIDNKYKTYYKLFSAGIRLATFWGIMAGSGSNMLFRREALLNSGGFDLKLSASEDTEMLWRVKKNGWKIIYHHPFKVYERDHRRLDEQGILGKTLYAWARSLMLFTGIGRESVRKSDWGYWKNRKD